MENKAEDKKPVVDKYTDYLYGVLKDNNAYDGDYNKFYNEFYQPGIKGYTYRKELYDTMTSHGIDLGASYEDFANWIGLHAIDPQTQQTPMGADSISKDMKPVEVTPTKKPEAKKEEKPEVSAEAVSENQHPTDTLQDFNPNVSRMRNAGTDYYLQAAEEISNNAYSKSLEELANQAAKELKKKAYQKPKEDSYVRLNQTARYIPIRSLPKDADLDSVFEAALTFENQVCGGAKEYTFAPLGGDIQERYEKWKALKGLGSSYTQETASMSPNAVYLQAINLQALGKERPAWISELRWNEALNYDKNKLNKITAELEQEDQKRRLKRSDGAYPDDVSLNGMYHANYTALMASDIYNNGTNKTIFVLFQDGRIRPLQAPDPSILRGGVEAQRELFRRQYEKMTFGEEGKEGYTDPYEKNRVVGNFLQNGEVCHIIYFPYMIEQRRWDDAQELIKIGLGGKFNEKGVLLNPDDRLQIVPVVVKNGESEEDAIAKAKVELDNEISKKLPYKETYLQQQIAQAREALKKEQERLKQLGDHDAVKGSYLPPMFNSKYYDDLLESSTEEGVKRSDEVALARGNIRKLEKSIKKYTQALEALRTGDKVGAWGGFLEGISDRDNWTFGLYNLRENLVAVKAHEGKMGQEAKDRLGLARSLSQESMSAFHRHGEGRLYGPAFGAGYSFPFTIGAIATYGAGNVAARGIIRGGSRMAAKYGTNWLFDTTIRATTRLAAINAAGVIDSSFQMPRIISDAAIEKMGLMNYTFDENQRIVVTGTQQEKSWGHSLLHSGLNTLTQNASERVGTYVLKPVAKAFGIGKISLRSFGEAFPYNKTIHMIQNGAFAKAMSKVYGTFEKGGYDGFVNEVLEEYIANPMTATFDENYTFADIFDSRQNLDTALSVWASSILMLGLSSTASSVKYYRTLRSVNSAYDKAEANARRLFGNENWDKIQNTILRLEGEPLVNAIYAGVCQNKSLSDEQKKAFLNYVRAQKAQAVFNNAVSEKYSFSLTGEELNEMNAMTIHAYAEGRNMQTPQEYAQAQQAFADTREMAMSALGVTDDIDAYLDTLGETPAEQLKKGVEAAKEKGLDEKAANAALSAYLNAREQQKGAMDGITSDESIRRQHADSVIRQITFENEADSEGGSGKVILVNVKGREKPVFLVRGRYENGSITGETVVVSEGNGVIEMIPASEVEGIVEESDAMTERQREYDKIDAENKEQQRLINLNMDTPLAGQGGILMDEEGHRRQVGIKCVFNDEQGNSASVLVVDQNNNDYLIPIDVFREQRGRGRKFEAIEPYLDETDEEYHAAEGPMNEEYNLANKEQEGVSEEDAQGAAEGVTPQPTTDATEKPTKPEVKYDYHVKMKDGSGNAVSGRVTNLSADGVEIEFDAPYNGKMVDRIPLADFDNGVSEIADANGNVLWNETEAVGDTEVVPQVDATPTQVGQEDAEKPAIAQAEQEHKPTALERIPRSENGEPLFEQAENPEVAWDALVEFSDGNAATAKEIADAMTEEKRKALEKARKLKLKGKTPAEMLASKQANAAELAKAESEYNHWQRMANVEQNRQNAIRAQQEAEARQRATERAEAEKAEREAREEAERREREALEGIPEWHMDTPENARKRGARRYGGQIFTRQEPVNGVVGKEVEVKFSQKDLPKGHVVVMEAEQLQPSHIQGKRNPMFFIEEAQPKNRAEDVSQTAAGNIAENIRPQEITSSTTAYTGAPTINTRGEVIQGNNRSDALRYLWQNNLPKQQQAYKQYLLDQAEQLGLDSNAINAMQHPVLVNQLDVDDAEAIRLGQMTAQDTESGGVERIKPKNVAQKLGDNMHTFANRLLSSSDNDATFGQLVDRNGEDVLNWMNQIGAISNTQYQSAFDSKGKLTPEAKNDLQKVLYQAVFKGGSQQLEEMFDRLPAKAQRAILSTAFRDMDSPFAGKMLSEIQSSIIAYNALMQDEGFASAKNMEEVLRAIEIFKHQTALDDRFEQYMPADNFSNFALHLAGLYKASDMSQTTIASYFNEMYDLAQGKKAATLFEEADTTEYPLAEVIKKVLGIDYKPAKNGNNNVANGGADVALRNQESQGRQPRSNKPSASGEQNQTGTESSERGEGVGTSDNEQGRQVDIEGNAPRKGDLAEAQENGPKNSTQSAIESASAEVETSPTEAQKKAGNYKMGHVKVGAFDVTIENPKGSECSGTDANGKKWSVKMNNTYGYIRGTEGVDGDHIDVFLAEDMDKWDGKYVFVIDQYNPDGTFDEHKVMLGFNSMEEARSAYLSNYEKGWENGRRIVVARIKTDDFQKWVDSSHRKTKPFAHYVIAGAADVSDNEKKPSASKKGKPHVSKENEVKRTVEHFPMETPEEAAAFDKRVPEMKDSELLAYMQEDGKGDINSAYHMNIYDEYDYRHTDEQTEAYNTYIQQLHDSNTTLEQAEEMLGNILGDVERFATDERSQLIGQSDALQDYITELERQKEDERAEAENSAENTDANHVGAADVAENKSAEPVEADKSKQYGEYQEVYDNFVSDVENRGMIPDLRAIKNKIRDTKRRLTVLKNGAATSIQSDEDLKRFETAEKKLTDLLHVYEAMRDYTEARIKKAEAAAQRKPWSEKNAQERMDEASKNPLTEEEIQNAPTDEVNKANALDYLSGNHGLIQSISYLKVYEDVRNPNGSAASDSGTKDKTQLAGRSNSASEGRDTGGKSGGTAGRVDNGGSRENVSEQSDGGKSGERSTRDNAGEGSNTGISTEEQPVGRRDANSGKPRRGGTSGRTRSDGGRSGRGESGNPATENGTRRAASESVKEESADDFLNQALGEFKDVLDDFIKAGRGELSISLVGLNSKQMEILPRLIQVGAKVGYAYIRKGVHGFTEWANHVKEAIGKYLRDANLSDDEIDAFIKEMWKSKIPFDGQIHTLEEWASIYSKKDLRNKVRTTIEEKREAQRQAESISVKTGDINNIRETLPFLLPQQQEDVLRAETQFFDETHQDREHANGKGYMFTNGTGTGKTYTGLGIVKRFVKQGKKRILILTPSQPKVRDWINDGKNLGLEIKSLDDWAKERGTTATTEAGEGTIITTYANFRQNEELLNGTFDLIVYDESHRLMENKNAANTIGTNQHHMIANRDAAFATIRLRKINPFYQERDKVNDEFKEKREQLVKELTQENPNEMDGSLVSKGLIPHSTDAFNWHEEDTERFPEFAQLHNRFQELTETIIKKVDPQIEEQAKKDAAHTKVVFLSATPFNTRENIDYAQGYIFSYPDKEQARGYSVASPQTIFFEEHFGAAYKWRYGRLEHSERNAEAIAQQEREFSDWLQHTLCTMSGRIIDSEYDYSRDFPVVSVEHAEEINNAAEEILRDKYFNMAYHKVFGNYNYAGALFETLKVATLIPRIKQHLEAGRKVVIFHRRVESKTPLIPPFAAMLSACHAIIDEMKMKNKPKEEIDAARHRLEELKEKWRGLLKWESMLDYSMPREQIAKAFGADNVLYFSGQESTKAKNQAVDSFNNDESGKNIIVIQEASGKEGISLHDTTGKHQRVLITLALPQSPITALQIEGRIYRIGNRSNAIFEYPLLGLNSEIILFGQKFNGQIGTTENLALGSQARNLRESFARSVEESGKDVPIEEQGFGGKEADAAERDETSPFDRAVLDYYGNQKLKGKRDSREGVDYYPTPEPLGFKMVEWGNLNDGETALEPSAGHGAIARYVPSANPLTAIEPSQNLFAKLQLKAGGSGRKFVNTIFEGYNVVNKHDVIFMNPPFGTGGRLAVDHVAKAFTHLTEGGRIVAIIPRGSTDKKFDKWIDEQENAVVTGEIMLPDITFQQAGTSVMARVLVIDKVTNQSLRSEAESKYRRIDLSRRKYDKIEDFFEDIRDIQMPSRTIDEKARMLKRAAPALRDIKELKGVVDVQAQEDGIDIRTKGSAMGFYLDLTVSDFSLQQQLRTKYQRYAQEIEWNEHRHNEKAVEIYKAYNDLVCRLLGKTAEEVESDITREKMGLEQPHEEQGVAINVAPQAEESPSSEQNESTTESSPYHYELKHHTKTGAEMFMAMPNEKSGLSSEEYSSMLAKAKKHGGYWNRFMKGFAFPSEKSAKDFLAETGNTEQKPSRGNLYRQGEEGLLQQDMEPQADERFNNELTRYLNGEMDKNEILHLGRPQGVMRAFLPNLPIVMRQRVIKKGSEKKHDVDVSAIMNMPQHLSLPIFVFKRSEDTIGVLTDMRDRNGKNVCVAIELKGQIQQGAEYLEVNDVRSFHGREFKNIVEPIANNKTLKWVDKEKGLAYLSSASQPVQQEKDKKVLNDATKVVKDFVNPKISDENVADGGIMFRDDDMGLEETITKMKVEATQAAQKTTENLNLGGRVVVHESAEGLEGKEATAKGWYDTKTGQIHVVLSNNADAADVTQTILHEAVAHHGLRELFGHNVMDAFLDSVLAAASQEVKDAINELRRGNGWNFRTATEEYLAGLAERTDFKRMTAEERGLFATIRRLFNHALEFLGLKNHELSDRELAYILWCSYQNLKTGEKGRYVAEAERIAMRYKLKAGKNAMTDTEKKEHSVLLRGKLDNLQEILAKDTYERLVTRGSHLERTAWVDMLSPLQDLQHAIEKNGGFKLGDFENPYNAYITMSSRNYAQMDIYKRTLYADMIEAIHALGSETGRSYEEIKTYVMAKHGMERQKYMAGKAAEEAYDRYKSMHPFGQKTLDDFIDEYEEKSFAGLTELFGTQSVSDAMDEAQKYVEEVEAEAGSLADSLWDSIRAATKSSLQRAYEAGLISKETYDNVSSMYQYYIPLRGFDETTSDEVYEYFGDQTINGGTGSFMKKAKGRKSVADDPFAVIGNMAEMAIMQSNRNLMKQQMLNLALNHPSDLISVSDLYVKFDEDYDNGDGTRGAWVPVAVPDTSGMTTEEANQVMLDFQDDMEEKVKDEPDTYALAHQKPHIPYRVLGRNMNEHQVMVKRGGKTYILTINGNPRAAQAINGLLNPDATENPGAIALKAMTNWIARMATARNVEFAISNAMRDLEFSTTLIPKEGTEYYGRYVKNYLTCVKNIGRLVNRLNGNTLDMSNPLEKAFYDFIYNGGETGYTFMKGVERYKGEITKALSELRAKEGKSKTERLGNKIVYGHHYIINDAWNIYMKGAEYLSRCTEDWVRFAVFLTSRQMGRSMEQSIMDAKEVTVNFNRKGAGSKSAGKWDVSNFFSMNNLHFLSAYAASAFKNFYAFSNASIQGLDKNVRLHLNHTAGMLMWDGAAVTLGMLSAMCIPLMLSAIGGDPDDYWDMPESMRRMGIIIPLGKDGRFLTLPMSIEHRAAYGIGELLGTVVCGSENLPVSEITFQAFEQLSQILPLDLTEGNGSMLSLVPTAVRPEVEIAFNKNWLGMPIYKEPFNKNTPAFRNVYQSTNPNYIAMSKWLNEVQGGGDYERAGVQVNPAMVQHLVESYTGGAGKFVSRTSGVIAKIIQGEQIRSNEIPFYRTLVKSVDDRTHNRAARERFQREYDKGQKLIYKIDNYQKESARGNSQYVKELDEFAKSKDFMSYMLWKSYNSVKSQFDNARSYIGDDKDKRAALDHAQMLVQKMMTECARAVENSKTQEEADEKIGRIQSEYTPQIKETLSKVEE